MAPQKEKNEIPLYTKIGTQVTTLIIIILSFFLIKNCVGSFIYGPKTSQQELDHYYQLGYEKGTGKSEKNPQIDNPLLLKTYRKGYRDGRDKADQAQ
jgi:hypothetical protein